jgi:hypothetical protein
MSRVLRVSCVPDGSGGSGGPRPELALPLSAAHDRRLRDIWRSAGWPCQDLLEAELLAAGLLERHRDAAGRETLRVTDAGVQRLVHRLARNRAARDAHEALVAQVATVMQRAGRLVWRGLSLRAPLPGDADRARTDWVIAMPDVFSIRQTTVEAYLEPVVHEVKVRRADLLADLRQPRKRAAYLALGGECWYVLAPGVGTEADVPETCGVLLAQEPLGPDSPIGPLTVLRPAPRRPVSLSFGTWMALARANAEPAPDGAEQGLL